MDFKDEIIKLGERVKKLKNNIQNEEATKTSIIMPFINSLGYDVFDPSEVIPEFTTDFGDKKKEKVDYAIMIEAKPLIIIECKNINDNLNIEKENQLLRYFNASDAKFSILTNGILYKFYTDLKEENKMDAKAFLEFDITEIKENEINELKKFHKSYFDLNKILNTANELKYVNEIKFLLNQEMEEPSDAFSRFWAEQTYDGIKTAKVIEQFQKIVQKALNQFISDFVNKKIKTALEPTEEIQEQEEPEENKKDSRIVTTEEEIEAYHIIKALLRKDVDSSRIFYRDTVNYFNILLDDNKYKTICRLYLNSPNNKKIGIFYEDKNETIEPINTIDDIYNFVKQLKDRVENLLNK